MHMEVRVGIFLPLVAKSRQAEWNGYLSVKEVKNHVGAISIYLCNN